MNSLWKRYGLFGLLTALAVGGGTYKLKYGHRGGNHPVKDLETGRGRLAAMHLKETVPGKFREIPFGTGHVDFESGIRKAWELGVRRYVTEFWYTGNLQWKEELLHTCQKFNELLEEISNS